MKRVFLFVLTIGLVLGTSLCVLAGEDNSGLEKFVIKGSDMYGWGTETDSADTKFASYAKDCYTDDSGLFATQYSTTSGDFHYSTWAVSLRAVQPTPEIKNFYLYSQSVGGDHDVIVNMQYIGAGGSTSSVLIRRLYGTGASTGELDLVSPNPNATNFLFAVNINNPTYTNLPGVLVMGSEQAYWWYSGWFGAVKYGDRTTVFPNANWPMYSGGAKPLAACMWKNRLTVASSDGDTSSENRLYFSSVVNPLDFTLSTGAAHFFDLVESVSIKKLIPTAYGLYIFCESSIWLITGGDNVTSWTVEKIYDSQTLLVGAVEDNDMIYFWNSENIFSLSGRESTAICKMPYAAHVLSPFYFPSAIWYSRYLMIQNYMIDLKTKSHYICGNVLAPVSKYNAIETVAVTGAYTRLKIVDIPTFRNTVYSASSWINRDFYYLSNWITLDGSDSTRKIIRKIEVDYFASASQEIYLYAIYSYGTDSYPYETYGPYIKLTGKDQGALVGGYGAGPPFWTRTFNNALPSAQRKLKLYISSNGASIKSSGALGIKEIRIYYINVGSNKGDGR